MKTFIGRNRAHLKIILNSSYGYKGNPAPEKINSFIQDLVDELKNDIKEYVKENKVDMNFPVNKPFMITDNKISFQPVPVVIDENDNVEFLCDDINFWLMVVTYELFKRTE